MDGVLVIGLHHGAGEGAVAAALAAVLRRQGEEVRLVRAIVLGDREADALHAFDEVASPLIAARHQGNGLDPEHLVADGVAVAERRQHLVDARRAGSGRAHCRLAAARLATAGPDGTSARMPAAGRSVFLRLANQPGRGSIAAGAGAAA